MMYFTVKPGRCPPVPADIMGICPEMCTGDEGCMAETKCCSNGCGHVCRIPLRIYNGEA